MIDVSNPDRGERNIAGTGKWVQEERLQPGHFGRHRLLFAFRDTHAL